MATLAEIRQKLQAQEDKKSNNGGNFDNTIFPHWNIEEGSSVRVRFLPDADPNNTFFWIERLMINLPFAGIKGDPNSKPVVVKVPCMEMWEPVGSCPILSEIRPWFKDPTLEDVARKYWKKRSYLMQGFVRESSLIEDDAPENPIRRFVFTPQIFDIIKAALMDPELEELPTDYENGLDFIINKTSGGQYASYATSKYARKESALTEEELLAIEEHGLFDLKSFLPEKPDAKKLEIIKEMFEASVDGEPYDPDRWAAYYAPPGIDRPKTPAAESTTDTASTATSADQQAGDTEAKAETAVESTTTVEETVTTPVTEATPSASTSEEDDRAARTRAILERVKNRNKA